MKTTFFTVVLFAFGIMIVNAKTTNEINSVTEFGKYEVTKTEADHVINHNAKGEYVIHYSELDAPVYVSVVNENNCVLYLVSTGAFELQYISNGEAFGVQFMNRNYANIDYEEILRKINYDAFRHQRIITTQKLSEEEYVKLIACFLPEVLG